MLLEKNTEQRELNCEEEETGRRRVIVADRYMVKLLACGSDPLNSMSEINIEYGEDQTFRKIEK